MTGAAKSSCIVGIGHGRTLPPEDDEEEASGKLPSVGKKPPLPPPLLPLPPLPEPPDPLPLPPPLPPPDPPELPLLVPEPAKPEGPDCVPQAYETRAATAMDAASARAVRRFMAAQSEPYRSLRQSFAAVPLR
jgi:hypothetical protein